MIRIQVKSTQTETVKWKDKATGADRSMELQTVYVYLTDSTGKVDDTPDKIQTPVNNNRPLDIGNYQLSPASFYLDRNRRLSVSLNNLVPLAQLQKQTA